MKSFSAEVIAIGMGVLGIAASRALLPQAPAAPAGASVNVTQHHNNLSRDGLFIDPAFTPSAAANLARNVNFDGTIVGNVYAQPLYVEGGPDNRGSRGQSLKSILPEAISCRKQEATYQCH